MSLTSWLLLCTVCAGRNLYASPPPHQPNPSCDQTSPCSITDVFKTVSQEGDTVHLVAGTYDITKALDTVFKSVTIAGAGASTTIIDCGSAYITEARVPAITLAPPANTAATLRDVTIRNCVPDYDPPARGEMWYTLASPSALALYGPGSISISNVVIRNSSAAIYAGPESINGQPFFDAPAGLTINGLMVVRSGIFNGGITMDPSACFDTNYASELKTFGSAMLVHDMEHAPVLIQNSTFEYNYGCYGGALSMVKVLSEINNCSFKGNIASGAGGAVNIQDSPLTMQDSLFDHNVAAAAGGITLINMRSYTIANTNYTQNYATTLGSAVRTYWDHLDKKPQPTIFDSCWFKDNKANPNQNVSKFPHFAGYTVLIQSMVKNVIFSNCHFQQNTGGGLSIAEYVMETDFSVIPTGVTITNSSFVDNFCLEENHRPSISISGVFNPVIKDTIFANSSCASGVAVTISGPKTSPTFQRCRFENLIATGLKGL